MGIILRSVCRAMAGVCLVAGTLALWTGHETRHGVSAIACAALALAWLVAARLTDATRQADPPS